MINTYVTLLCTCALLFIGCNSNDAIDPKTNETRQVTEDTNLDNFPFIAFILAKTSIWTSLMSHFGYKKPMEYICTGSIISSRLVVTAGMCIVQRKAAEIQIMTGSKSTARTGHLHKVEELIVHPHYMKLKSVLTLYDIGLVVLAQPLNLDSANQFESIIPISKENIRFGQPAIVVGWNELDKNSVKKFYEVHADAVVVLNKDACINKYIETIGEKPSLIPREVPCGYDQSAVDCANYYGRPVLQNGKLVGIVYLSNCKSGALFYFGQLGELSVNSFLEQHLVKYP